MSILLNVLFAWKCSSTHHKIALDALRFLDGEQADAWRDCLLAHADAYFKGAKAPDDTFKDFTNHVLHVAENFWGGAPAAAVAWYAKTVEALEAQRWSEAAYAAGVLSHYYSDPLMPLHTAQSEAEGAVHRALEWSVTRSYDELRRLLEQRLGGFPRVTLPTSDDWLQQMVKQGAALARPHYEALIERYDLARGVKDPSAGLDQTSKECIARLLGHAVSGFAKILGRAIADSGAQPPQVSLTLQTVLATLTVPLAVVTKKLADQKERVVVEAIYREVQQTGKAIHSLPEDDFAVRSAHAAEVLKVPLAVLDAQPVRRPGAQGASPRPSKGERLRPDMAVEKAPSIGPKTAARLATIQVKTVADLLAADPAQAARSLGARHITAATISDWQAQSALMCEVPNLLAHDAQMLVGAGVRKRADLAAANPKMLLLAVERFLASPEGQRAVRSTKKPDAAEVTGWVASAAKPLLRAG